MTAITLKQLKAKITRLHHLEKQWIFLDNDEHDMIEGEGKNRPYTTSSEHANGKMHE